MLGESALDIQPGHVSSAVDGAAGEACTAMMRPLHHGMVPAGSCPQGPTILPARLHALLLLAAKTAFWCQASLSRHTLQHELLPTDAACLPLVPLVACCRGTKHAQRPCAGRAHLLYPGPVRSHPGAAAAGPPSLLLLAIPCQHRRQRSRRQGRQQQQQEPWCSHADGQPARCHAQQVTAGVPGAAAGVGGPAGACPCCCQGHQHWRRSRHDRGLG